MQSKKNGTRNRSGDTRDRIMSAAEDAFAYYGFSGASLQDIADRVGVKKASLFYYFKGKEELYAEVIQRVFKALEGILFPTINDASANYAEKIEALVGNTFDMLAANPNYARMLYRELLDNEEAVAEASGLLFGPLFQTSVGFLQRGIDDGQLKTIEPMHYVISTLAAISFFFISGPLVEPHWGREVLSEPVLKERRQEVIKQSLNAILTGR